MPAVCEIIEASHTAGIMSNGFAAPHPARTAPIVVGMSCREAVFIITSIQSESDARGELLSLCKPFAARIPAGVAALPNPRRLAEMFAEISCIISVCFFAEGNKSLTGGCIKEDSFSSSFERRITSMIPLQNIIIPAIEMHSSTEAAAPSIAAEVRLSSLPVKKAQRKDTRTIETQSFPIIYYKTYLYNKILLKTGCFTTKERISSKIYKIKVDINLCDCYTKNMKSKEKTGDDIVKSTGIIRKIDELGRVVLPIELRRKMGIGEKDSLEIYVDGDAVILKKYEPACIFCGESKNITEYKDRNICANCIKALSKK